MTSAPNGKLQLNVYVPHELNDFIDEVRSETGVTKSDFITLLLSYAQANFSHEDILALIDKMTLFGPGSLSES